MEDPRSDSELVQASLKQSESYRFIITRYRPKLLRYIGHLGVADMQLREDILQEVFIKVYRHLNGYDDKFLFSSWIYRITHNETMSYFRRKRLHPLSLDNMIEGSSLFISDHPDQPEETIDPERITKALQQLDQKYRDVIVLKYFEDKSYDEMADILHKPPGTIATLINRAKQQIKTLLEKELL